MNVHQLKDLSHEERMSVLEGESIRTEEQSYMKPLNEQELADMRIEFSQAAIDKAVIEDEYKTLKDEFKERLSPLHDRIKESLTAIKHRAIFTKGKVYLLPDYENKVVHIIDPAGVVIDSRMMKPEERQFRISNLNQKIA